MSYPD